MFESKVSNLLWINYQSRVSVLLYPYFVKEIIYAVVCKASFTRRTTFKRYSMRYRQKSWIVAKIRKVALVLIPKVKVNKRYFVPFVSPCSLLNLGSSFTQREREREWGQWTVYYNSPQRFIITFSYTLA